MAAGSHFTSKLQLVVKYEEMRARRAFAVQAEVSARNEVGRARQATPPYRRDWYLFVTTSKDVEVEDAKV
jgi:hypothetical protein